jgi:hypothetical protein
MVVGNPGRIIGWMCQCGVKLDLSRDPNKEERTSCSTCGAAYVKNGGTVIAAAG